MQATLRRVGGSTIVAVPSAFLDHLHLEPGNKVNIALDEGRIILEPASKPRYTLAQLLAKTDFSKVEHDDAWVNGGTVGEEVL